jgi:hypothetical protein
MNNDQIELLVTFLTLFNNGRMYVRQDHPMVEQLEELETIWHEGYERGGGWREGQTEAYKSIINHILNQSK